MAPSLMLCMCAVFLVSCAVQGARHTSHTGLLQEFVELQSHNDEELRKSSRLLAGPSLPFSSTAKRISDAAPTNNFVPSNADDDDLDDDRLAYLSQHQTEVLAKISAYREDDDFQFDSEMIYDLFFPEFTFPSIETQLHSEATPAVRSTEDALAQSIPIVRDTFIDRMPFVPDTLIGLIAELEYDAEFADWSAKHQEDVFDPIDTQEHGIEYGMHGSGYNYYEYPLEYIFEEGDDGQPSSEASHHYEDYPMMYAIEGLGEVDMLFMQNGDSDTDDARLHEDAVVVV